MAWLNNSGKGARGLLSFLLLALAVQSCAGKPGIPQLERIKLPPGFRIEVYAGNVPGARSLCLSPSGTLYVGTRDKGKVYALPDKDGDGAPDRVFVIAEGLEMPNGVAFRGGSLYVAEVGRVLRYDDIEKDLAAPPAPVTVSEAYPEDGHHGWKFIRFGPDGLLYEPVGAPCNVCERKEKIYASITRLRPEGGEPELYARGVRNTVGFDWRPGTRELWFTDNGRDWLGDDEPPDELNRAPEKGLHFGFPYFHGSVRDPKYGKGRDLSAFMGPAKELGAHSAALGMRFYTGKMFPEEYRGQIFIAEHGSWNRTEPAGYRVALVRLKGDKAVSYEPFAEGWLRGSSAWGRPVDLELMPDGSLLVSDDRLGAVYRISYAAPAGPGRP
ncbi:MAG: PQQ-dependent sugar dehydrogenase [Elusimicrobia bacterium]|nr:PQQ-dependent sugar dehydrogenase [Elusimicrobiota bacterium]